ncbi:replication-associated recombination protein A [Priestia endophytica]|uniref:replication-associated recombination protein A n=1 Tax=Priestia endophytica TaxID=135735 RepID=UPI000DCA8866|nr:replication-associated recombination protein A [Priestia endophytica]RAS83079.1 recombination factor protein RarA [Priestia endophytica]
MDLFDMSQERHRPLADKMRPKDFNEFFGQKHLLGKGKVLRNLIENDKITSMILQGPPSTGKTSLAHIISEKTNSKFVKLNSVSLTVKELRDTISKAKEDLKLYQKKTIVFIDEIHAMKSNVQMTLLPSVEEGTIVMIGATTESVMHEIIPPLASRCRIYTLKKLEEEEIKEIVQEALYNEQRGLGADDIKLDEDALNYLADISDGDIRDALGALETAYYSLDKEKNITLKLVKETYEQRLNNISTNDEYNLMSAFIKSMRGSQTDAALYWLARMLYSGVDPMYIARRIVVHSVEDVGMANPHALTIAMNAKDAVAFIGASEGRLPLAQAVVYICESPKSNSVYKAINSAMDFVKNNRAQEVPENIQQGSKSYKNPIDYPNSRMRYINDNVKLNFYKPQNSGTESKIFKKHYNQ